MSVKKSDQSGEKKPSETGSTSESDSQLKLETVETSGNPVPEVSDLAAVVQESQAALAEAPPPIKNKGGRPKGAKTKNRSSKPAVASSEDLAPALPEKVSLAGEIGMVFSLPFAFQAKRTGFKGWELDLEQATACGASIEKVMDKYFPDIGNKVGVEVSCAFTVFGIFMLKHQEFKIWAELEKSKNKQAAENQTVQRVDPSTLNGHDKTVIPSNAMSPATYLS